MTPLVGPASEVYVGLKQVDHLTLADAQLARQLDEAVERLGRQFVVLLPQLLGEHERSLAFPLELRKFEKCALRIQLEWSATRKT